MACQIQTWRKWRSQLSRVSCCAGFVVQMFSTRCRVCRLTLKPSGVQCGHNKCSTNCFRDDLCCKRKITVIPVDLKHNYGCYSYTVDGRCKWIVFCVLFRVLSIHFFVFWNVVHVLVSYRHQLSLKRQHVVFWKWHVNNYQVKLCGAPKILKIFTPNNAVTSQKLLPCDCHSAVFSLFLLNWRENNRRDATVLYFPIFF